jgi:enediyne biosynthesis protein E4
VPQASPHATVRAATVIALLALPGLAAPQPADQAAWELADAPPFGLPRLVNATAAAGLGGFHHAGWVGEGAAPGTRPLFPETMGPGACWFDIDGDDWLDLFLVNGLYMTNTSLNALRQPRSMLFRNLHNGGFADVTDAAGVGLVGIAQGCAAADYDNDGHTDFYVSGWRVAALFHNGGDGTFSDVTDAAGVRNVQCGDFSCWGTTATWFDYDRDGCLDLFVSNFTPVDPETFFTPNGPGPGQLNRLYHSGCDGTFEDVAAAAGLADVKDTWASVAADLDDDGWPDLYVGNDGDLNDVYINQRDGTFRNRTAGSVANNAARNSMGVAVGDLDGDGRLDLASSNYVDQANGIFLASGSDYVDMGMDAPFDDALPLSAWALRFTELDNDGRPDLVVMNGLPMSLPDYDARQPMLAYRNKDGASFDRVRDRLGPDFLPSWAARGAAWADDDNDGDVDLLVGEGGDADTHLYRSIGTGGNFLNLDLRGTAAGMNRDAIGARVRVAAAGLPLQTQEKTAGDGLLSTSDPRLHFGLGGAPRADVTVRWPDDTTATYGNVRANSFLRLVQGDAQPHLLRALPLLRIEAPALARYGEPASLAVAFDAAAGESLSEVRWDFGDGTVGEAPAAEHAFADVGALLVQAAGTDSLGRVKGAATRVRVWDELQASVAMDQPVFAPFQPATGRATVRFSDGRPVAGAALHLHVTYASGVAEVDALMPAMPQFVRDALGYVERDFDGVTGADGVLAFTVPYSVPSPSDYAQVQANHAGTYTLTAIGGARGSTFPELAVAYQVGVPLP